MSYPSIRLCAGAVAALAALLLTQPAPPLAAAAQQPPPAAGSQAILQGVVVHESNGQPIESATVSLVGTGIETQTGRYGGFAFPDVQPGLVSLRVSSPEHPAVTQEIHVRPDAIAFVRFVLPSISAVLDDLLVGVRRNRSLIADPETAADLLVNEAPRFRFTNSGIVGRYDAIVNLRGARSFGAGMQPLVFIDGVLISKGESALEALRQIPASHVLDLQVLQGPAAAFLYPLAANGVILVRTMRR